MDTNQRTTETFHLAQGFTLTQYSKTPGPARRDVSIDVTDVIMPYLDGITYVNTLNT